ncbi:unnamed protein product [Rotaria sp. Silwood2]|nr:unnamed protein product [Rotaria sp. Silwood2]CAF2661214.1 unnamed protein product [Rotaria sp. Silwood2]CAF3120265.1 unnamed protein product [Rotaria sp. Silwood2]CAF3975780.1 unnamed protein product [Rotaria sp. Silwood2]CAF4234674.1 unnamed protein product [Rotaria sp. Silwood2]
MISSPIIQTVETTTDEHLKINVYDDAGYLPIHRAAYNGHELVLKNILEKAQRRAELQIQLEATTHDINKLTSLLLATSAGRLDIIAYLLTYIQ